MSAVFGASKKPELFSPLNGTIISKRDEERFEKGYFMIVPDVPDIASAKEIKQWHAIELKEHKIRIVEPEVQQMTEFITVRSA